MRMDTGVVANFFSSAPGGWGRYALVESSDYEPLRQQIGALPCTGLKYNESLTEKHFAGKVAEVFNVHGDVLERVSALRREQDKKTEEKARLLRAEHDAKVRQQQHDAAEERERAAKQFEAEREKERKRIDVRFGTKPEPSPDA
jgi:hypothetical protein